MTGYVRNDTENNIADNNVIDAVDLDGEFDAIQAAFASNTGHTHDGTSSNGAPITVVGPAQEFIGDGTSFSPKADNTYSLGSASKLWSILYATTALVTNLRVSNLKANDGTAAGSIADSTGVVTLASAVLTTADINGGTADAVTIGATTPAAGSFTDVNVTGTVDGRDVATDGTKLDAVESSADVTDATNVTAAGALMDSELTSIASIKALDQGVATTDSPTFAGATLTTADIDGGTIDGTAIGATTPSTGSFSDAAVETLVVNGNSYPSTGALSSRNLIINGAMQIAQRGVTETGVNTSGFYTVDRFSYTEGSGGGSGVVTMDQSTDAPVGFGNSAKFTVTTTDTLAGTENVLMRYTTEGEDCKALKFGTAGGKFTISFWVKASLDGLYSLQCNGGNVNRRALSSYTVDVADTWEYKTVTFNVDPTTAIAGGNDAGLAIMWMLDSGPDDLVSAYDWSTSSAFNAVTSQVNFMATSGATWQITGVQVEAGDVATPFEYRKNGEELSLCQRYYEKIGDGSHIGGFAYYTTTSVFGVWSFKTEKRANPSVSTTSASAAAVLSNGSSSTSSAISFTFNRPTEVRATITTGARTSGDAAWVNLSGGSFIADAEL